MFDMPDSVVVEWRTLTAVYLDLTADRGESHIGESTKRELAEL